MLSPTREPFLLLLLLALAGAALSSPLAIRQDPKAACKSVMVFFARGTTEVGPYGTVVGPPFLKELEARVGRGNVKFEGVPYPADIVGYLAGGDPGGSVTMAKMVGDTVAACPGSKVVMSGYSQGGQLVHNAAKLLPPAVSGGVAGAVIFGDPDRGQPVVGVDAARTLVICNEGDLICDGQPLVLPAHLTYGKDADKAAEFVVSLKSPGPRLG